MNHMKHFIRTGLRAFGYDVVRALPPQSLAAELHTLFARLHINCVLDVGGHFGEYGNSLRELGYKGQIVSFEPIASSFAVLQQQCRGDVRWTAHNIALGRTDEARTINVMRSTNFSSFLRPGERSEELLGIEEIGNYVERKETVAVRRLDAVLRDCTQSVPNPRIYLKMDTQGWDLEVLSGAEHSLDNVLAMQSEISVQPIYEQMPGYLESIARMSDLGFELSYFFPVSQDSRLRAIELDCVMVRTPRLNA